MRWALEYKLKAAISSYQHYNAIDHDEFDDTNEAKREEYFALQRTRVLLSEIVTQLDRELALLGNYGFSAGEAK